MLERLKTLVPIAERLCPILADLSTQAGCTQAIKIALQCFGTIEVLINNAGIGMSSIRRDAEARYPGIEELTPEIWDRFFSIFVRAPVMLTRATLMRDSGFGRIINKTTSYLTMLRVLPYGSAKAASSYQPHTPPSSITLQKAIRHIAPPTTPARAQRRADTRTG